MTQLKGKKQQYEAYRCNWDSYHSNYPLDSLVLSQEILRWTWENIKTITSKRSKQPEEPMGKERPRSEEFVDKHK